VYYTYNNLGQLGTITTKIGSGATQTLINNVTYLPFGPAQSFSYGNGLTHSHTYDQDYRLTSIQVGGLLNRTYGYDPVNNITSIVNSLNNTNNQSFSYDALNRVITANGGYGNLSYGYDAVGNRLSETRNSSNDTYQYETNSNRLTGITRASGNRNFTYDAAGNPLQRTGDDNSSQSFTFNKANRLSGVSVNGADAVTYLYNGLGQRVMKTLSATSKEIYHYDEAGRLISVTDQAGVSLRDYIYWGDQQIALANNGSIYYIHNDHLNTPQVITNQSQQVVWMGDYEPFGKVASNTNNSIEVFSRFPGQYFDSETGLYYNYFRDYDPSIGRYIESDPIGLGGGINTYAYANGNPIRFVDPTGENAGVLGGAALLCLRFPALCAAIIEGMYCSLNPKMCALPTDCPPQNQSDSNEDKKECDKEWASAERYCSSLYDNGYRPDPLGKGIGGKNYTQCVRGQVSEACGGSKVEF
jgi:RHS repeat-associated protein